jgi:hypothetical protein
MSKPREERIADMSERWWDDCHAAGFTSKEGMQRLLAKFGNPLPPSRRERK